MVLNSKRTTIMTNAETKTDPKKAADPADKKTTSPRDDRGGDRRNSGGRGRGGAPRRGRRPGRFEEKEFEQRILSLDRVTRVTKGGKRMRFRAAVIIGDVKTNRVGYGVSKATDVANAVNKAVIQAKKSVFTIPLVDGTIAHEVRQKYGAARIMLKPAPTGTGVKAGGAVRVVVELGGIPNISAKILGGKNKLNNAKATLAALRQLSRAASKAAAKPAPEKSEEKAEKAKA